MYYQYQGFMSVVELLENLIHDWVSQIGHHGKLHLPEVRKPRNNTSLAHCTSWNIWTWFCSSYSSALLISSAALSIRALWMVERGMETCSEMDDRGGLSLSAAEQDMGHNSRQRDTMESTTTWTGQNEHGASHHLKNCRLGQFSNAPICFGTAIIRFLGCKSRAAVHSAQTITPIFSSHDVRLHKQLKLRNLQPHQFINTTKP